MFAREKALKSQMCRGILGDAPTIRATKLYSAMLNDVESV